MRNIAFSLLTTITFLVLLSCCSNVNNPENNEEDNMLVNQIVTEANPVMSPSGLYILEMLVKDADGVSSFNFLIKDSNSDSEILTCEEYYRLRDVTYLLWGDADTVWVYSGDVGTFYWEKSADGWEKKSYAENKGNIEVPQLLQELKPTYYN